MKSSLLPGAGCRLEINGSNPSITYFSIQPNRVTEGVTADMCNLSDL